MSARLRRDDFAIDAATLAQRLLGAVLVHRIDGERMAGRIVETEAYLGVKDRCCHSFGGRRTPRVEPMYGPAGTAYVYFTYGMHHCMNVVCGAIDEPVAVLLRALEPVEGIELMRERRMTRPSVAGAARARVGKVPRDEHMCRGPASLCRAMGIPLEYSGIDMAADRSPIWIEPGELSAEERGTVECTARIGLGQDSSWVKRKLRWVVGGSASRSR